MEYHLPFVASSEDNFHFIMTIMFSDGEGYMRQLIEFTKNGGEWKVKLIKDDIHFWYGFLPAAKDVIPNLAYYNNENSNIIASDLGM